MKKLLFVLIVFFSPCLCFAGQKAEHVLVKKSESRLYLINDGKIYKEFHVVFGANPEGHKIKKGDNRTPEGTYFLEYKNENSDFYKSIRLSYPNTRDRARAKARGVDPGGHIMIHGQRNEYGDLAHIMQQHNWTDGCIAVTNQDMDKIWDAVDIDTPITILP